MSLLVVRAAHVGAAVDGARGRRRPRGNVPEGLAPAGTRTRLTGPTMRGLSGRSAVFVPVRPAVRRMHMKRHLAFVVPFMLAISLQGLVPALAAEEPDGIPACDATDPDFGTNCEDADEEDTELRDGYLDSRQIQGLVMITPCHDRYFRCQEGEGSVPVPADAFGGFFDLVDVVE